MQVDHRFTQLIQQHTAIITKICRAYSDNKADFDDYFQEVTLQLWKSYPTFQGKSELSTWVYRVALNVCLLQLRNKKKTPPTTSIEFFDKEEDHSHHDKKEKLEQIYAAIRRLKEADRAIMLLYLDDKSYQEIADILGISISNVGVKVNRCKTKLKELING